MPAFIDTHAHLDYPDFEADLLQVIERAQAAGVTRIISVGTSLASSARAIQISERFAGVYAAVGWHPSDAEEAPEDIRPELLQMALHPKVVAIGETGLDYYRLPSKQSGGTVADDDRVKRKQAALFQQQLEVAAARGLNVIIHQREALADVLQMLAPFQDKVRGVFHCFVDSGEIARQLIAAGHWVSFTGILTFKNGQNVRDALASIPLGQFMLETDCPFLAPMPYRGKRCEPAHVLETARVAAQLKSCSVEELCAATSGAAEKFFLKMKQSQE